MLHRIFHWVTFCLVVLVGAQAFAFQHVVTLGDSLLDDSSGGRSPVAAEHIAERLGVPLTKFARSGSTSSDLIQEGQHTQAATQFGAGDLAMLWIGGNDFFQHPLELVFGDSDFLNTLESNADTALLTLSNAELDLVVFNLPDISKVPAVREIVEGLVPEFLRDSAYENITEETIEWNHRLASLATSYEATVVDVFSVFNELAVDPSAFTILGNDPILNADTGCQFCVFFDDPGLPDVHPSSFAQGFIANEAIAALNERYSSLNLEPLSIVEIALLADVYAGDFDGNSVVDGGDLMQWQQDFGSLGLAADADGDGDTDGADFLAWQREFGSGDTVAPMNVTVPEPASCLLLIFGLLNYSADIFCRRQ